MGGVEERCVGCGGARGSCDHSSPRPGCQIANILYCSRPYMYIHTDMQKKQERTSCNTLSLYTQVTEGLYKVQGTEQVLNEK